MMGFDGIKSVASPPDGTQNKRMMIKTTSLLLGLASALLFTSSSGWADNPGTDASSLTPTDSPAPQENGGNSIKAFASLAIGSSALASVPSDESKKDGYQFDVTGLLSFYRPKWDFDLGLGYFSNNMSTDVHNLRVVTNGAMLVFDPQYRFTPHWQLGLAFNLLIGSDVSFSESEAGTNGKTFNLLGGIGAKYEIPVGETSSVRLLAQILSTITATDRLIWIAQGGVQFGLQHLLW